LSRELLAGISIPLNRGNLIRPGTSHIPMKSVSSVGRCILAGAVLAFGIQHFIYAGTGSGLGPPWTPENRVIGCLAGLVLTVAAVSLAMNKLVRLSAILFSGVCFLRAVIYYAPQVVVAPRKPGPWTSAFELLAMCGASWVLAAATTSINNSRPGPASDSRRILLRLGQFLFAASLVVFGAQHLMYGHFVATLIPVWMPGRLFWAYFIGIAFIAAALAIASGKLARLASTLLGTMFLLWVVMLHAPRVMGALHNSNEWTSLFVALAMSGCGFVIAGAL
jgi:uncharacterized membrane protein